MNLTALTAVAIRLICIWFGLFLLYWGLQLASLRLLSESAHLRWDYAFGLIILGASLAIVLWRKTVCLARALVPKDIEEPPDEPLASPVTLYAAGFALMGLFTALEGAFGLMHEYALWLFADAVEAVNHFTHTRYASIATNAIQLAIGFALLFGARRLTRFVFRHQLAWHDRD